MSKPTILPPLRRTAADAEAFARVVHAGQVDKAGRPYGEHLDRVAKSACRKGLECGFALHGIELDEALQIAWLHDTLEDDIRPFGRVRPTGLRDEGFSNGVVEAVSTYLTKPARERYETYIGFITASHAPLSVLIVKLADMEDNADPERLALLPDDVRTRLERKYGPALERLRAAVERGMGR